MGKCGVLSNGCDFEFYLLPYNKVIGCRDIVATLAANLCVVARMRKLKGKLRLMEEYVC